MTAIGCLRSLSGNVASPETTAHINVHDECFKPAAVSKRGTLNEDCACVWTLGPIEDRLLSIPKSPFLARLTTFTSFSKENTRMGRMNPIRFYQDQCPLIRMTSPTVLPCSATGNRFDDASANPGLRFRFGRRSYKSGQLVKTFWSEASDHISGKRGT